MKKNLLETVGGRGKSEEKKGRTVWRGEILFVGNEPKQRKIRYVIPERLGSASDEVIEFGRRTVDKRGRAVVPGQKNDRADLGNAHGLNLTVRTGPQVPTESMQRG